MNKRTWNLKRESELRCEIGENETMSLKLTSGSAEIFGIELSLNKEHFFTDENFAVFTWYGCTLETSSTCDTFYESDSTPMISYVNTHVQLEARRDVALKNGDFGPRVLVTGTADHGKSTTSRILAAYAARLDRKPVYVDLDVSHGQFSIPGAITALGIEKTSLNIEVSSQL